MAEIGQILLEKYYKAAHIPKHAIDRLMSENTPKSDRHKLASTHLMVYLSQSPDYCVKNDTLGSLGTSGRYIKFFKLIFRITCTQYTAKLFKYSNL